MKEEKDKMNEELENISWNAYEYVFKCGLNDSTLVGKMDYLDFCVMLLEGLLVGFGIFWDLLFNFIYCQLILKVLSR